MMTPKGSRMRNKMVEEHGKKGEKMYEEMVRDGKLTGCEQYPDKKKHKRRQM